LQSAAGDERTGIVAGGDGFPCEDADHEDDMTNRIDCNDVEQFEDDVAAAKEQLSEMKDRIGAGGNSLRPAYMSAMTALTATQASLSQQATLLEVQTEAALAFGSKSFKVRRTYFLHLKESDIYMLRNNCKNVETKLLRTLRHVVIK
jgi:hypothetical protein